MAKPRSTGKPTRRKFGLTAKQSPLERYVAMLEAIACTSEANLSDLAELCHLPFSSAHRVLHTLVRSRLVVQTGGKRNEYALGPRLVRLLHTGLDEAWLRITGQRVLEELAQQFNQTCFVNKLVGKSVVTAAWAAPKNVARGYLVPGITQPWHATASAKAILAYQSPEFIRDVLPSRLPKLCAETKVKLKDVLVDLEQVRARGFATCWNEFEQGVAAVASPIFLPGADVMYSVGTTGLSDRLSPRQFEPMAAVLRDAATILARAIQHRPTEPGASNDLRPTEGRVLEMALARQRAPKHRRAG